jgi:hypothetical protein
MSNPNFPNDDMNRSADELLLDYGERVNQALQAKGFTDTEIDQMVDDGSFVEHVPELIQAINAKAAELDPALRAEVLRLAIEEDLSFGILPLQPRLDDTSKTVIATSFEEPYRSKTGTELDSTSE